MARKPKYRRHSTRDLAFVEHDGKRTYMRGPYGSQESLADYSQFLRERGFLAYDGRRPEASVTLIGLAGRFLDYVSVTYSSGRHSYAANLMDAVRKFGLFADGYMPAADFSPLKMKAFQAFLVERKLSRRYVNDITSHIRFMFKWAVSEELVPVTTWQALLTVPGLRRGRSGAKETTPRKPVPAQHVAKTLPKLNRTVRAMVQFQALTGVRSQSVCLARPSQFDRRQRIWIWHPRHKTEHRGHVLTVFVGPKAQKIIAPFLKGKQPTDFVFQPQNKAGGRSRRYRSFYDPDSYRTAVRRAAKLAGVAHWSPHQLRHGLGTLVREKFGLEAAQAVLGHVRIDATQIYAQKQLDLAKRVAQSMG